MLGDTKAQTQPRIPHAVESAHGSASPYLKGAVDALLLAKLYPTKFLSLEPDESRQHGRKVGPTMLHVNVVRLNEQDLLSQMVLFDT